VTNTLPDLTPYNAQNPGNDVLVTHVGNQTNAKDNVSGKNSYAVPDDVAKKQYVSFEKFGDTHGLVIQVVRVYIDEADLEFGLSNVEFDVSEDILFLMQHTRMEVRNRLFSWLLHTIKMVRWRE